MSHDFSYEFRTANHRGGSMAADRAVQVVKSIIRVNKTRESIIKKVTSCLYVLVNQNLGNIKGICNR